MVFDNDYAERARQMFADQFEPEGDGYLYRRGEKDAPVRVSAAERDQFVAQYNRGANIRRNSILLVVLGGVLSAVTLEVINGIKLPDETGVVGIVGLGISFMFFAKWAFDAPARALRGRGAAGTARTASEVRQRRLARLGYGDIWLCAVAGIIVYLHSRGSHSSPGWSLFGSIFAGLFLLLAAIQLFRKWRAGREK